MFESNGISLNLCYALVPVGSKVIVTCKRLVQDIKLHIKTRPDDIARCAENKGSPASTISGFLT